MQPAIADKVRTVASQRALPRHPQRRGPACCAAQYLHRVMLDYEPQQAAAEQLCAHISSAEDAAQFVRSTPSPTPWLRHFHRAMLRTTRALDHEMLDHPIATLIVVSSAERDAVACADDLCAKRLPTAFSSVRWRQHSPVGAARAGNRAVRLTTVGPLLHPATGPV